jgi:predicted  nucleic acid-binding Zn-ribbon protein
MANEHGRYFIELQPQENEAVPRRLEAELRREQAADFIAFVDDWLRRESLENKVASMAITALGQVQIICDADIIDHLRDWEEMHIAAIRNGAMYVEGMGKWEGRN